MLAATIVLSVVIAPPRSPVVGGNGGDKWQFVALSLQEGADLISEMSRSYVSDTPDFGCNPLLPSATPQGFVGFSYERDVRMVLHFYERMSGVACVSTICVPEGDFVATQEFFQRIASKEHIVIGEECLQKQPRYRLIMANLDLLR